MRFSRTDLICRFSHTSRQRVFLFFGWWGLGGVGLAAAEATAAVAATSIDRLWRQVVLVYFSLI